MRLQGNASAPLNIYNLRREIKWHVSQLEGVRKAVEEVKDYVQNKIKYKENGPVMRVLNRLREYNQFAKVHGMKHRWRSIHFVMILSVIVYWMHLNRLGGQVVDFTVGHSSPRGWSTSKM